jgi:DeoR family transcriptional regulator of aga operon
VHPLARTVLEQVHADIAFIGCNGVDAVAGVTNVNLPEAEVKQLMVASADRVVVLADASKLGQVSLGAVCGVEAVDVLLTNEGADVAVLADLTAAGVEVVTA